jgi:hypothetical protein
MAQPSTTSTISTVQGDQTFESVNPANLNQFWGDIASQLGMLGIMGEHSAESGTFTPNAGDGGRTGVGNLSKDDPRFLPEDATAGTGDALANGAQGFHAVFQAARLGDPNLPPDSVESTVGPLFPDPNGNVTAVDLLGTADSSSLMFPDIT